MNVLSPWGSVKIALPLLEAKNTWPRRVYHSVPFFTSWLEIETFIYINFSIFMWCLFIRKFYQHKLTTESYTAQLLWQYRESRNFRTRVFHLIYKIYCTSFCRSSNNFFTNYMNYEYISLYFLHIVITIRKFTNFPCTAWVQGTK